MLPRPFELNNYDMKITISTWFPPFLLSMHPILLVVIGEFMNNPITVLTCPYDIEVLTYEIMWVYTQCCREIAKHLSLPPVKLHCSMLAEDAIKAAVKDYEAKRAKLVGDVESPPVEKTSTA